MKDDVISRQAAIDGFYEMASDMDHLCTVSDYVSFLESLPTAQAKVVRCKECDFWGERQGRMYCYEMYFDQDDPDFYCGYARRKIDG